MSWKEVSPVFSLTHEIPLGENMEKPDEDPGLYVSFDEEIRLSTPTDISRLAAVVSDKRAHHI